ncbi:MAG: branched-chain amino acid transaminase [Spirochaetota bacterium]|nr:branched-chain amino acid transaminase [Spirochaetota bacterium]
MGGQIKTQEYAYFKREIVPVEEANINIKTHAFQYGTGCFCGIRGYWNDEKQQFYLYRLKDHYERLYQSAKILMMNVGHSIEELIDITVSLVKKNQWKEHAYFRPILYKSDLSISPRLHDVGDDFAIYTIPLGDYLDVEKGLSCRVSSWTRLAENMIPTRAKASGGYINSALAKSEAMLDGYDEAIFLDSHGYVSEGSAENIFLVRNGKLITPQFSDSILEGITRRSVIHLAKKELGIEVEERSIGRSELYVSDEAFFCGTGVQLSWIREIDRRVIGDGKLGKIAGAIQKLYFDVVMGNQAGYEDWLTPVY